MQTDIEARFDHYGRLEIHCDERDFRRLFDRISDEDALRDIFADSPGVEGIRAIVIVKPAGVGQPGTGYGWNEVVLCLLGACISGSAQVVGFVVIIRWI